MPPGSKILLEPGCGRKAETQSTTRCSNIDEVKARGGCIIGVISEDDHELLTVVDHAITIPRTTDMLTPILASVPLQLLAYHIAVLRGTNVDQPRNLAKSVTVE